MGVINLFPKPAPIATSTAPVKPNIVLIVTDDQRYDTTWVMTNLTQELKNKGVTFEKAFVNNPLCCPSRTSILKGQYSHTTNCTNNASCKNEFNNLDTLSVWLQNAGYRTGLFGKYLNGYQGGIDPTPPGWSKWVAFSPSNPPSYFNTSLFVDGQQMTTGSLYSTDYLASEAINFMLADVASFSSSEPQPFFVYFTPSAPHSPAEPSNSPLDVCPDPLSPPPGSEIPCAIANLPPWRPPSYNESDLNDKPTWLKNKPLITPEESTESDEFHKKQLLTLLPVDRAIGQIVAALKKNNKINNTVIIFTSDNGLAWGEHRLVDHKPCPYDECLRVPMIIRAPGLSPRVDTNNFVQNTDLAPTILDLAKVPVPANANFDGISLKPILFGQSSSLRNEILFESLIGGGNRPADFQGIKNNNFTYVYYPYTGEEEFYDLNNDPYQLNNQANGTAQLSSLRQSLTQLRDRFFQIIANQPDLSRLKRYPDDGTNDGRES